MRHRSLCWLVLALAPAIARADDSNIRPYLVGAQASGMGGADTALADDGTGPYYNPAGIAFALHPSLSLSASVYGLVTGREANVLGAGHDFTYSDLNTFPVSTAIVRTFGAAHSPDHRPTSALGLAVFVPDAEQIDDRANIGSSQNTFFLSGIMQTVWGGVTYAHRWGRLSVGASAFGLLGSEIETLDLTEYKDANTFATITSRIDKSTKGVVAAAGVRYDATPHVHLGLSVYAPELGFGSRRAYIRVAAGAPSAMPPSQIVEVIADDLHTSPTLPLRIQGGFAWTGPRLTVAADAIVLGPRTIHDDPDRAMDGLDELIVRRAVVDGSLGVQYVIAGSVPVRAGVFTDRSAAPTPVSHAAGAPDPNPSNSTHVDRYGATLSLGYRTDHTATDVGAIVSYGTGTTNAPQLDSLDFTSEPTRETQLYTYVFITSSYAF